MKNFTYETNEDSELIQIGYLVDGIMKNSSTYVILDLDKPCGSVVIDVELQAHYNLIEVEMMKRHAWKCDMSFSDAANHWVSSGYAKKFSKHYKVK